MFDGQVVRPPESFKKAAKDYVCVRITNINEVDLNAFPFDFDLTMAVILANADGTVYHRYGGRAHLSPMFMESLVDIMEKGLETHRSHQSNSAPAPKRPPLHLPELADSALKGMMQPVTGCYHCHYAREASQLVTLLSGRWTPDKFWIYPHPKRIGLVMDQKHQYRVSKVVEKSAAKDAGVRAGDVLLTLNDRRILTKYDIQWILNQADVGSTTLPFSLRRNGERIQGKLALEAGWKVGDPADYSWRTQNPFTAHMIKFLPAPGFIGELLTTDELSELGMRKGRFALYVSNLTHGPHQAGIRLGDVILSAAGRSDFTSSRDFFAWCESLRREGRDIRMKVRREGHEMEMMVSLSYLNYTKVERAPRIELGFTAQQLPGFEGVRVGNVLDDSSAEKVGLVIGDRIISVGKEPVSRVEKFLNLVDQKAPGDSLTLEVTREGKTLTFTYLLSAKEDAPK